MAKKKPDDHSAGKPFTDMRFATSVERHAAEHEVFLAFTNDSDCMYFHDWWHDAGAKQFQAWIDANKHRYGG